MKGDRSSVPPLEWIASAIGLLLILGLLTLLVVEAVKTRAGAAPAIEVEAIGVAQAGSGFVVEFAVRNRSRATAAAVEIEGELVAGGERETSRALIDYVPGRSERKGGLFFRSDPRGQAIELRALGYQEP